MLVPATAFPVSGGRAGSTAAGWAAGGAGGLGGAVDAEAAVDVVGENLAVGLAGRAVVDGVVAVDDRAHRVAADRAGLACAVVDRGGPLLRGAHLVAGALERQPLGHSAADRLDHSLGVLGVQTARHDERRQPGAVAHLVREPAPQPGEHPLVAEEPVQPLSSSGEAAGKLIGFDLISLRAQILQRRLGQRIPLDDPNARLALGPRLGKQECIPIRETPPHEPALRATRGAAVRPQPSTLHEVDDVALRTEPQDEEFAAPCDGLERLAGGRGRRWRIRLQRREGEDLNPLQDRASQPRDQPLGVSVYFWKFWHLPMVAGPSPGLHSGFPQQPGGLRVPESETVWLSKAAYDRLTQELEHLRTVERPRASQRIGVARAHGDIRENAEYDAAKEEQGKLEGRIRQLEATLRVAKVGEAPCGDHVVAGMVVTTVDADGVEETFLLGSREDRPVGLAVYSAQSPLGKALIGHGVGDTVSYQAPAGAFKLTIKAIRPLEE